MPIARALAASVLLVAGMTATGCSWRPKHASAVEKTAIFQPDYQWGERVRQPEQPPEIVPVSAIDDIPNVDTFTVTFRAIDFSLPASAANDVSERAVASQSVTIITDQRKDEDGLLEGSIVNEGGRRGTNLLKIFSNQPPYELIVDDPVRLGPHKVAVRLRTSNYKKPGWIRSDSDGTQWNVTVTIDGEYSEPRVSAVGGWTGAHAAELIINNTRVYRHATSISYRSKDADTKNSDGKDSKPKNITWSDIAPRAEEASTTSDDIRVNTRLSKPEFRP